MKTILRLILLAAMLSAGSAVAAEKPNLGYVLTVDLHDTTSVEITLRARNLPATFHLAMVRHFLVDDESWRRVGDLQVSPGTIARQQDGLWEVTGTQGDVTIRYKIRLDEKGAFRVVRKPFLTPSGGLVGDLHMFMYVVEAVEAPAHVTLHLPADWTVATSLTPTSDPRTFYARDTAHLSDSPVLCGQLHEWHFQVDQVPIRVAYWPLPDANPFDEKPLVEGLRQLVQRAADLFGGAPWREYVFQVRDGTDVEGFEHTDSATVGVPSADLAAGRNPDWVMITHEFFHTWNMMRFHTAEYAGPTYKPVELSGLWASEGFTVFYADLLARRAGLPTPLPTRLAYLKDLIETYLSNPETARYSAEQASRGAFKPPVGDAHPDRYMLWEQSELLAVMLDLSIRDATDGKRSLDDLMRAMNGEFSGQRGFTTADIERLAGRVSGRRRTTLFDDYVRRAGKIDVNRFLGLAGLQMDVGRTKAKAPDGTLQPDTRVYARLLYGEDALRLFLTHPDSAWLGAGLRNCDQLVTVNGLGVATEGGFDDLLKTFKVGDRVKLRVIRAGKTLDVTVAVGPVRLARRQDQPIAPCQ